MINDTFIYLNDDLLKEQFLFILFFVTANGNIVQFEVKMELLKVQIMQHHVMTSLH